MKELMELVRSGKVDPIPVEKRPACEANQTLDDLKEWQNSWQSCLNARLKLLH
jgi:predicted  nucleic acid-binding Zn ribbon protein